MNKSQDPVAIIGMACLFPGAPDLDAYWHNILNKVDAITDPPPEAWDMATFYDPHSHANDRVYCKKGGFIGPLAYFDPLKHGVLPNAVQGGEPDQWLALDLARNALQDAGYTGEIPERQRAAVIIGRGTYLNRGNTTHFQHSALVDQTLHILRRLQPHYTEQDLERIRQELKQALPPFNADTAPGLIPNVIAGRIANKLDLMGPSYTVDAACASSLVALEHAVRGLRHRDLDLALVGGAHVVTPVGVALLFCQLDALSHRERIRPFDAQADGTLLGEGIGMVVLKRLSDAVRAGQRVYAVIQGVGLSSDGRGLSVMAPRLEGEVLAMQRAYEQTDIAPRTLELIEAHGTGTPVGDATEIEALAAVFGEREGALPTIALGSVKSMIGHLMPAAGIAGLIKAALAIYHKVLPPTLNVEQPHPKLERDKTPFYLNTQTRPWIHGRLTTPRRAGVNAFGFGGINAHAVLEEYLEEETARPGHQTRWDSEVVIVSAESRQQLIQRAHQIGQAVAARPDVVLKDLAFTFNVAEPIQACRLAIVAADAQDLSQKLARACELLSRPEKRQIKDTQGGVYYFQEPLAASGKLAFLFPGIGSQYLNMLADLCIHFPEVRAHFDRVDSILAGRGRPDLPSDIIFPRPAFEPEEQQKARARLWQMQDSVETVWTADLALFHLLTRLGLQPDAIVGHSVGEYVAMQVAHMLDLDAPERMARFTAELAAISTQVAQTSGIPQARLTACAMDAEHLSQLVAQVSGQVYVGMDNCPHQAVLIGEEAAMAQALELLDAHGIIHETLAFGQPYHTPLFDAFSNHLRELYNRWLTRPPQIPMYSCTIAAPYPTDVEQARRVAVEHWTHPVRLQQTIRQMYDDGVRLFVEVGPRSHLAAFVGDILGKQAHLAVPSNVPYRSGLAQLNHLAGLLAAHGVSLDLGYLYARRAPCPVQLDAAPKREHGRMQLMTGWPRLNVSEETAQTLQRTVASRLGGAPGHTPAAPIQAPPATPPPAAAGQAMAAYLQTMDRFLTLQQEVMQTFLAGRPASPTASPAPEPPRSSSSLPQPATLGYPFIRAILSRTPEALEAVCKLDLQEDILLRDHALGGRISLADPDLIGLPVMPMTGSMEMMAEAAAVLVSNKNLIGMRHVTAHRWVTLDQGPVTIKLVARRRPQGTEVTVHVQMSEADTAAPLAEGTMILGDTYPPPPSPRKLEPGEARPSRWAPGRLYQDSLMFHGPRFQGVVSLDAWSDAGACATVRLLPTDHLFASNPNPNLVVDPILLDQAGQVVGFWGLERLPAGIVMFPYRLRELHVYGPGLAAPGQVQCRADIRLLDEQQVQADMEVIAPDGRVWLALNGWQDRCFELPENFYKFLLAPPPERELSQAWRLPSEGGRPARRLDYDPGDGFFTGHGEIWQRVLACAVLGQRERATWRSLPAPRRLEWLLERAVAKDAVRQYLAQQYNLRLGPADVEIMPDERGRLTAQGAWLAQVQHAPAVSLAHLPGAIVAVAHKPDEDIDMVITT